MNSLSARACARRRESLQATKKKQNKYCITSKTRRWSEEKTGWTNRSRVRNPTHTHWRTRPLPGRFIYDESILMPSDQIFSAHVHFFLSSKVNLTEMPTLSGCSANLLKKEKTLNKERLDPSLRSSDKHSDRLSTLRKQATTNERHTTSPSLKCCVSYSYANFLWNRAHNFFFNILRDILRDCICYFLSYSK